MDTIHKLSEGVHAVTRGRVYQCRGCDAKRHMGVHFHRRLEWCDRFYSPLLLKILVDLQGQKTEYLEDGTKKSKYAFAVDVRMLQM